MHWSADLEKVSQEANEGRAGEERRSEIRRHTFFQVNIGQTRLEYLKQNASNNNHTTVFSHFSISINLHLLVTG